MVVRNTALPEEPNPATSAMSKDWEAATLKFVDDGIISSRINMETVPTQNGGPGEWAVKVDQVGGLDTHWSIGKTLLGATDWKIAQFITWEDDWMEKRERIMAEDTDTIMTPVNNGQNLMETENGLWISLMEQTLDFLEPPDYGSGCAAGEPFWKSGKGLWQKIKTLLWLWCVTGEDLAETENGLQISLMEWTFDFLEASVYGGGCATGTLSFRAQLAFLI